jgi:hypothetical protein
MNNFGSHIGLAVEEAGRKKAVQEHIIEVNSWMNICNIQENMSGLIGEFKHILRSLFLIFGKRKLKSSITMMMKH